MLINTLGVAVPTSHHWPMGDEGKQAMKQGGVAGPPPYPVVTLVQKGRFRRKIPKNWVFPLMLPVLPVPPRGELICPRNQPARAHGAVGRGGAEI